MMTAISRLGCVFGFSLLLVSGCSAGIPQAPTNQLIKGSFIITTEWQTITFDKPLQSAPHIQYLELRLCDNKYEFVEKGLDEKRHMLMADRLRGIEDNKIVDPEVIVNDGKSEYQLSYTSNGYYYSGLAKNCKYVGYSLRGKSLLERALPEGTEFTSIRIRANDLINIDHMYWNAPSYKKAPNATWESIHSSKIINLEPLILNSNNS